jgi:hypothetical protein
MPTPEGRVKNKIKKLLNQHGVYYDMPVPYGYGKSGLDFYGCHHGRFFGGMVFVIDDDAGVTMLDAWLTLRGIG